MKDLKCRVFEDYARGILALIICYEEGDSIYVLQGNNFVKHEKGKTFTPTVEIPYLTDRKMAQAIVDGFARIGVNPTQQKESESELKATKYHLEDMRKFTFKELS